MNSTTSKVIDLYKTLDFAIKREVGNVRSGIQLYIAVLPAHRASQLDTIRQNRNINHGHGTGESPKFPASWIPFLENEISYFEKNKARLKPLMLQKSKELSRSKKTYGKPNNPRDRYKKSNRANDGKYKTNQRYNSSSFEQYNKSMLGRMGYTTDVGVARPKYNTARTTIEKSPIEMAKDAARKNIMESCERRKLVIGPLGEAKLTNYCFKAIDKINQSTTFKEIEKNLEKAIKRIDSYN